jgi:hypothetical protein
MSRNILDILVGQKIEVINNYHEKTILTISYVEPSNIIKDGISVVFTNGTFEDVKSLFDIAFI